MNLAVDLTSLSENWGGMQYYTRNFVEALIGASSDTLGLIRTTDDPGAYFGPRLDEVTETLRVSSPLSSRVFLEQAMLPLSLQFSGLRADRLLVPAYLGPMVTGCPVDMIVYDFLYLQSDSGLSLKDRLYWKGLYRAAFNRADRLYPISRTTREAILERMPHVEDKVGPVLYPGHRTYERDTERTGSRSHFDPFMLFVGTISPRKNVSALVEFYRSAPDSITEQYDLRLAGQHGWGEPDPEELHSPGEGIYWEGRVSDRRLMSLYTNADLLVLPSRGEGFGLPILEAFRHRLPVVLSPLDVFREVAGQAAWYLPSTNYANDWHDVIGEALENSAKRREKSTRGYRRSRRFRWSKSATRYLDDIRETA